MVIFDMIYRDPSGRVVHIGRWDGTTEAPPADWVGEEGPVEILPDASRRVWSPEPIPDPPTEAGFSLPDPQPDPLGEELERARRVNRELFSNVDDDLNPQAPSDWDMDGQGGVEGVGAEPGDPEKEALREQVADLQRQLAERDAEPPPLSPDPVKHMIPDEIRKLMEDGESLSNAKRRLTELLWVEQAELRNLRGTDRGDLKREAEIERLLGLFARLGEI